MKISDRIKQLPEDVENLIYAFARDDSRILNIEFELLRDYIMHRLITEELMMEMHLFFLFDFLM